MNFQLNAIVGSSQTIARLDRPVPLDSLECPEKTGHRDSLDIPAKIHMPKQHLQVPLVV